MNTIEWMAGLFVGEGCVTYAKRKTSSGKEFMYPSLTITMLDRRSVEAFATFFNVSMYEVKYQPGRPAYRVGVVYKKAVRIINELLPHIEKTDKGDQAVRVLKDCGFTCEDGTWVPPAGRKSVGMKGNANAKGKHWVLTEETRRRQSEARQRREAARKETVQ